MKYLLLLVLFFNFSSAQQNINITTLIKNEGHYFEGSKDKKQDVKVRFDSVSVVPENADQTLVAGILATQHEAYPVSGKIEFSKKKTKELRDLATQIFDCVLMIANHGIFEGTLAIRVMPGLFNVIVFEGVLKTENNKLPMHFDNSNQIMRYLESLK